MCRNKHPTQQYDGVDAVLPKYAKLTSVYTLEVEVDYFLNAFIQRLLYDSRCLISSTVPGDYLAFRAHLTSRVYIEYLRAYVDTSTAHRMISRVNVS